MAPGGGAWLLTRCVVGMDAMVDGGAFVRRETRFPTASDKSRRCPDPGYLVSTTGRRATGLDTRSPGPPNTNGPLAASHGRCFPARYDDEGRVSWLADAMRQRRAVRKRSVRRASTRGCLCLRGRVSGCGEEVSTSKRRPVVCPGARRHEGGDDERWRHGASEEEEERGRREPRAPAGRRR